MKKHILSIMCGALLLSSCSLYKTYKSTETVRPDLYSDAAQQSSGASLFDAGWQNLFTDPQLQDLISRALQNNSDMQTAMLTLQEAETVHKASKLAYLPSILFSPTGSLTKLGSDELIKGYDLGIDISWTLDIVGGGITNARRQAKAGKAYADDLKQAVECRLVAMLVENYYALLALDRKAEIHRQTIQIWTENLDMIKALYNYGYYKSPAVHQAAASLAGIKAQMLDIETQRLQIEVEICRILGEPASAIQHGSITSFAMPQQISIGVPADLLRNRPDVRAAERKMEMEFYNVQIKKGAFYPSIRIDGRGGWLNPQTWFINGIGSLVQPIFMQGKLRADLKIAKLGQQKALVAFRQTVIDAGAEVHTALHDCNLMKEKALLINEQVNEMNEAYKATRELMTNGTSTYLEVIIAQDNLLNAQMAEVENSYRSAVALIRLYSALGGK